VAIGEAKHTASARPLGDLTRLERIRTLLVERGAATAHTKLLLFSQAGFDRNVVSETTRREDVNSSISTGSTTAPDPGSEIGPRQCS